MTHVLSIVGAISDFFIQLLYMLMLALTITVAFYIHVLCSAVTWARATYPKELK